MKGVFVSKKRKKSKVKDDIENPAFFSEFSPSTIQMFERDLSSNPIPIIKKTEKLISNYSYGKNFSFGTDFRYNSPIGSADSMYNNGDKTLEKTDGSLYGSSLMKYTSTGKDFMIDAKSNKLLDKKIFQIDIGYLLKREKNLKEQKEQKEKKKPTKPFTFIPQLDFDYGFPEQKKDDNQKEEFNNYPEKEDDEESREIHYREDDEDYDGGFSFNTTFEEDQPIMHHNMDDSRRFDDYYEGLDF